MRIENLLCAVLFSSFLVACEDARVDEGGVFVGPAPRLPSSAGTPDPDAGTLAPKGSRISGRIETDESVPILGRPVVLVDARGKRTEVLSDEGGAFYVDDVVTPYDLAVAAAPSGSVITPTVYIGLTRHDPFIELFERDGASDRPPTKVMRVAVQPPPCPERACTVSVVTVSPSGGGAASASYAEQRPLLFEIEHEWRVPFLPARETIDLHVLTADAARTTFTYARKRDVPADAGAPADLGTLEPVLVAPTPPLSVRIDARGFSADWSSVLATWLELPGGGSMSFTYGANEQETIRLPMLPGAGFRASAWKHHPAVQERPYFQHAAQAWSGTRPIAGGTLALAVAPGPAPARPAIDGTLSRRGLGIAWTNPTVATPLLTELTVADVTRGAMRYRVWTTGNEVPFANLDRLGLARLDPGDHVLGLTSTPDRTTDAVVDPLPSVRRGRFDAAVPGSATYERFRFRVTQ